MDTKLLFENARHYLEEAEAFIDNKDFTGAVVKLAYADMEIAALGEFAIQEDCKAGNLPKPQNLIQ